MPEHEQPPRPSRRKLWRWVLISWGVLALVLVMAAIGSQIEPDDTAPATSEQTTTTHKPADPTTTRRRTTTTRQPATTTTTAPAMSVEDCLRWEQAESELVFGIGDSLGEMAAAMAVGDADMAHSWYWHAKGQREVLYFDEWLDECGHHNPEGAAVAALDYIAAEDAWETVERICRDALEPLGLAC